MRTPDPYASIIRAARARAEDQSPCGGQDYGKRRSRYKTIEELNAKGTCGAKTRAGTPCKRRDLYWSGRCKLHGGCSTGPRTLEGKKISAANGNRPKIKSGPQGTLTKHEIEEFSDALKKQSPCEVEETLHCKRQDHGKI